MSNIIRVFRAFVKPGKEDEFKSFFLNEAIPLVRKYKGLVNLHVGLPDENSPHEFLMITIWSSTESLKQFAGKNWRNAVIDPREKHLLEKTSVNHYYEA